VSCWITTIHPNLFCFFCVITFASLRSCHWVYFSDFNGGNEKWFEKKSDDTNVMTRITTHILCHCVCVIFAFASLFLLPCLKSDNKLLTETPNHTKRTRTLHLHLNVVLFTPPFDDLFAPPPSLYPNLPAYPSLPQLTPAYPSLPQPTPAPTASWVLVQR